MKKIQDKFSTQSKGYKRYRPVYPAELYEYILSITKHRSTCWDCGTGNGQVAQALAPHFERMHATDISENQIAQAEKRENIEYHLTRVEKTEFADHYFDLVTVGQSIHWFDFTAFNKEVRRVTKNGGTLCVWGYGLLSIHADIDELVQNLYRETLGNYWNEERAHVDARYCSVDFDFKELDTPENLEIKVQWTWQELVGYLRTWSSVQNYKRAHNGENPIDPLVADLAGRWGSKVLREISFPIFMRAGIIEK